MSASRLGGSIDSNTTGFEYVTEPVAKDAEPVQKPGQKIRYHGQAKHSAKSEQYGASDNEYADYRAYGATILTFHSKHSPADNTQYGSRSIYAFHYQTPP
jgi:hypothetical protein